MNEMNSKEKFKKMKGARSFYSSSFNINFLTIVSLVHRSVPQALIFSPIALTMKSLPLSFCELPIREENIASITYWQSECGHPHHGSCCLVFI